MLNAFNSLCDWLECSCEKELFTLANIQKCKLVDHYGDHIVFTEISGKKNTVCFQDICSYVVSEKWHCDQVDSNKSVVDPEGGAVGVIVPPSHQMHGDCGGKFFFLVISCFLLILRVKEF